MRCYSDEILQQYYDDEFSFKAKTEIEKHLGSCNICERNFKAVSNRSLKIKKAINEMTINDNQPLVIPSFIKPQKPKSYSHKQLIWIISAACFVAFILSIHLMKLPNTTPSAPLFQSTESIIDANQPICEQEITMQYIDGSGNVINLNSNLF